MDADANRQGPARSGGRDHRDHRALDPYRGQCLEGDAGGIAGDQAEEVAFGHGHLHFQFIAAGHAQHVHADLDPLADLGHAVHDHAAIGCADHGLVEDQFLLGLAGIQLGQYALQGLDLKQAILHLLGAVDLLAAQAAGPFQLVAGLFQAGLGIGNLTLDRGKFQLVVVGIQPNQFLVLDHAIAAIDGHRDHATGRLGGHGSAFMGADRARELELAAHGHLAGQAVFNRGRRHLGQAG